MTGLRHPVLRALLRRGPGLPSLGVAVLLLGLALAVGSNQGFSSGGPPPPLYEEAFERLSKIIEDKSKAPKERADAVAAFQQCCGIVPSVKPKHDALLKGLLDDPATPLGLWIQAAARFYPTRQDAGDRAIPFLHRAMASEDVVAHEALSRAAHLFSPVTTLRALTHDSPIVRKAGVWALRKQLDGARLSERSATAAKPALEEMQREPERWGRFVEERPGASDAELAKRAAVLAVEPAGSAASRFPDESLPRGAIARMGSPNLHHEEEVRQVAYSPDGTLIASADMRKLRLWDATTGALRLDVAPCGNDLILIAFSPDGKLLAVKDNMGGVSVFEVATGREVLSSRDAYGSGLGFADNGRVLLAGGGFEKIHRWEVASRRALTPIEVPRRSRFLVSPDNRLLLTHLFRVDQPLPLVDIPPDDKAVTIRIAAEERGYAGMPRAFSPDGKLLAVREDTSELTRRRVVLLDVATGRKHLSLEIAEIGKEVGNSIRDVAFSADGKLLAASDFCGGIHFWELPSGRPGRTINTPRYVYRISNFYPIALSADGMRLAFGGQDGAIRVWNVATGEPVLGPPGHGLYVSSLAFWPDDRTLATQQYQGNDEMRLRLWDARSGRPAASALDRSSWWFVLSPDGRSVAALRQDGAIEILAYSTGRPLKKLKPPDRSRYHLGDFDMHDISLTFSPDGATLVGGYNGGILCLWDVQTAGLRRTIQYGKYNSDKPFVRFLPDGKRFLSVEDRATFVRSVKTGERVGPLDGYTEYCRAVMVFRHGDLIAMGGIDPSVRLGDVPALDLFRTHQRGATVFDIQLSPDGILLTRVVAHDEAVHVWDAVTAIELLRLKGHVAPVHCLAFSLDGTRLASGSDDTTALIWTLEPRDWAAGRGRLRLDSKDYEALWEELGADDTLQAYSALCAFWLAGNRAVAFLKEKLAPIVEEEKQLRRRIAELDDADWSVRETACQELEKLGVAAEAALRDTRQHSAAAGAGFVAELLEWGIPSPRPYPTGARLQRLRAIIALGRIGTRAARRALQALTHGAPLAFETQFASRFPGR